MILCFILNDTYEHRKIKRKMAIEVAIFRKQIKGELAFYKTGIPVLSSLLLLHEQVQLIPIYFANSIDKLPFFYLQDLELAEGLAFNR